MYFETIKTLLDVVHMASKCGPQYSWAADKANEALNELKAGPKVLNPQPETPTVSVRR